MPRITVGLIALGFGVLGSLLATPAGARTINRCNVSAQVNLMPGAVSIGNAATDGDGGENGPVECRGGHAGPWHRPTLDDLPEPDIDVEITV